MWYVLLQAVFPALLIFHDPVYVVSLHVNLFALSLYHFQTLIILRGIVYPFIRFFWIVYPLLILQALFLITSLLKYILTVHALLSYSIDILIRIYCHYLVLWIWNEPLGFNRVRMSLIVQNQRSTDGESKGRQQWDFPETIWIFIFLFWN